MESITLKSIFDYLHKLPREIRILIFLELPLPTFWFISKQDERILKIFNSDEYWEKRIRARYNISLNNVAGICEEHTPFTIYLTHFSEIIERNFNLNPDMSELIEFVFTIFRNIEEDSQKINREKCYVLIDEDNRLRSRTAAIFKNYSFEGAYVRMCTYISKHQLHVSPPIIELQSAIMHYVDDIIYPAGDVAVKHADFIEFMGEEIKKSTLFGYGHPDSLNDLYLREASVLED